MVVIFSSTEQSAGRKDMSSPPNSLGSVIAAATFAAQKHSNQRRKDTSASPYINHPLALANVLSNEGGVTDSVTLCAALLHDTVEDTDTNREELTTLFGRAVADVVMEVTDDKALPKAERKRLQVAHTSHMSERAKLVKLADKISNLRDILASPPADWSPQRKKEYFDWAASVVQGLRGVHPQLEAVFNAVYSRHAELA